MSVYMVERGQIQYIVEATYSASVNRSYHFSYYWKGRIEVEKTLESLSAFGQMLWDANRKSIEQRYPDTKKDFSRAPGPIGEDYIYKHVSLGRIRLDPFLLVRALDSYEYQACESDEWEESKAHAAISTIFDHAVDGIIREEERRRGGAIRWKSA